MTEDQSQKRAINLRKNNTLIKAVAANHKGEIFNYETDMSTININTNASKPDIITKLFDVGVDSVRVSMNSVEKSSHPIGIDKVVKTIKKTFPNVLHGYFSPPKEKFS